MTQIGGRVGLFSQKVSLREKNLFHCRKQREKPETFSAHAEKNFEHRWRLRVQAPTESVSSCFRSRDWFSVCSFSSSPLTPSGSRRRLVTSPAWSRSRSPTSPNSSAKERQDGSSTPVSSPTPTPTPRQQSQNQLRHTGKNDSILFHEDYYFTAPSTTVALKVYTIPFLEKTT